MAKTLTGLVISATNDKTITVAVTTKKTHPIYGKQYLVTNKYLAHDEKNQANVGDQVIVSESRPYSKKKHYTLDKIIEKSRDHITLKEDVVEVKE